MSGFGFGLWYCGVEYYNNCLLCFAQTQAAGTTTVLRPGAHRNNGGVTTVLLRRDFNHHGIIPYVTVRSVTLIAMLRLGLLKEQRAAAYYSFVHMPLYVRVGALIWEGCVCVCVCGYF